MSAELCCNCRMLRFIDYELKFVNFVWKTVLFLLPNINTFQWCNHVMLIHFEWHLLSRCLCSTAVGTSSGWWSRITGLTCSCVAAARTAPSACTSTGAADQRWERVDGSTSPPPSRRSYFTIKCINTIQLVKVMCTSRQYFITLWFLSNSVYCVRPKRLSQIKVGILPPRASREK